MYLFFGTAYTNTSFAPTFGRRSSKTMKHLLTLSIFAIFCSLAIGEEISLRETEKGYDVLLNGKLFAGYITDFKGTPIVWPIIGPNGHRMTRDYPMKTREGESEKRDHPHHRSLWFTHGEVGNSNYWHLDKQKIVHRSFEKAESDGTVAVIASKNDWLDKNGRPLCRDIRTLRFGMEGEMRYIDFHITVTAVQDEVEFKDTKEGTFAIRVPGTMDVTANKRNPEWGGHIINAEGLEDAETWGKPSSWVDYYGPVEGQTAGIAILNHPSSFRYPTRWHVRDYGLFAANPFAEHDFDRKNIPQGAGAYMLKKGDSFTLRYRILFHKGDTKSSDIAEAFQRYSNESF